MTLAIGLTVLAIIVALKRVSKKTPGALIAVIGAILANWCLDPQSHGVPTVGSVPGWSPEARFTRRAVDLESCVEPPSTGVLNLRGNSGPECSDYAQFAARYNERFKENLGVPGQIRRHLYRIEEVSPARCSVH